MTRSEIQQELNKIAKSLKVKDECISRDANLFGEEIFDSMDAIEYMILIEDKFKIKINDEIVKHHKLGKISSMSEYLFQNINDVGIDNRL